MNNTELSKNKHKEILELYKRLSKEIWNTFESYYLWRSLYFSRSSKIVGKNLATRNVKLLNQHRHFFLGTEHAHLHIFIIGINKFFDPKNLGFESIITKIRRYQEYFPPDIMKTIAPDRFIPEDKIYATYKPITNRDISEITRWKKRYNSILSRLKTIRDKQSAHTGFEIIDQITFKPKEVDKLIEAIEKIFNKLTYRFNREKTSWINIKRDAPQDLKLLFHDLFRGKEQRLKEIKEKWGT